MFLNKIKYALSTGNFRVPQTLALVQARLSTNPFCDNKFHLHGSKKRHFFIIISLKKGKKLGVTQR